MGLCLYCLARRNQTNSNDVIIYLSFILNCLLFSEINGNPLFSAENTKSGQEIEINNAGGPNDMDYLNQNLQGTYNLNPQELPFIDMENINEATDNFSDSNKLGQGGFGPVYKVIIKSTLKIIKISI